MPQSDTAAVDLLVADLVRRIQAFEQGDPGPIRDEPAASVVRELRRLVGGPPAAEVGYVVAWLHWYRYLALPDGVDDLTAALELFADVARVDLQAAPRAVRHCLTGVTNRVGAADHDAELAGVLLRSVVSVDDPVAENRTIDLLRSALRQTSTGHPDRAGRLANLGAALRVRFEHRGEPTDLDEAVDVGRTAVAATRPDDPDRAAMLSNLSGALQLRWGRGGLPADLDEAVDLCRGTVTAAGADHPDRARYLSNLSVALRTRSERYGEPADLNEAVAAGRQAVSLAGADHLERPAYLSNLATALLARYVRHGDPSDANGAVDAARQAVAATGAAHPDRAARLANLGGALRYRHQRHGDRADLDDAVDAARQAVAATPAGHPNRGGYLAGLSVGLLSRFWRNGAHADLDEAIDAARGAVAATSADQPSRARRLSNLASALRSRYERHGDRADVAEAIDAASQAVAVTSAGQPERAGHLSNLAGVLGMRFGRDGIPFDVDGAVDAARRAVAATQPDHPDRARHLANLGGALRARHEHGGVPDDLHEAIDVTRAAAAVASAGDPERAAYLSNLGGALRARYRRDRAPADLDEALQAWSDASTTTVAPVSVRLGAAHLKAHTIATEVGAAAASTAYDSAVRLLPLLAWRGIDRADQQQLLSASAASLARDAAACAIAAGDADRAVQLLELGRGVLWAQMLDTRTDLAVVEEVAPALANELQRWRAALEQQPRASAAGGPDADDGAPGPLARDTRMRAARRFDELVAQVRALQPSTAMPHPEDFLEPPASASLRPPPDQNPVVIVNVSQFRCDALGLTHRGIQVIELPGLTEAQLVDEANHYLQVLRRLDDDPDPTRRLELETSISATLDWLWRRITEPILDGLGYSATPTATWPRLHWCPTGALALLPLHAAGRHGVGDTVMDRVVSSYAPTLRALALARTHNPAPAPARMLVIALPRTPQHLPLPGAFREQKLLESLFDAPHRTLLAGKAATRQAVVANLGRHRWLHASCHGTQDLSSPTDAGLLPHDWADAGLVAITDLTRPGQAAGELAFLSACKTATGGVTNLDEVISIAAAMQYVGWRHVIGTLWTVPDAAAAIVARGVYPQLVHDSTLDPAGSARALHHTIRALRDRQPDRPSTWAPFIHIGP